jgi:hypothetical protein
MISNSSPGSNIPGFIESGNILTFVHSFAFNEATSELVYLFQFAYVEPEDVYWDITSILS